MQMHRPILTPHRLQRFILWTLAMLAWFGALMFVNAPLSPRHAMQRGDISPAWLTRAVTALLIIRALHILGRTPRPRVYYWVRNFGRRPSHFGRSLLGARLRRALKHKDPATHVARLVALLRNLDGYAGHLARCLRGRRRRLLRLTPPIAPATALASSPPCAPALADSS